MSTTLPPADELAGRVEEARNSAKLLVQLSQTTSPWDFADNELLKEFSTRCQSAQRSVQGYMNCTPPPDENTFQTLIETSELLSVALNKYQRAALAAHRQTSAVIPPAAATFTTPASSFDQHNNLQQQQDMQAPSGSKSYQPLQGGISPNPFSDEHLIHSRHQNDAYVSQTHAYDANSAFAAPATYNNHNNHNTFPPPQIAVELPLSRTPPAQHQSVYASPMTSTPPTSRKPVPVPFDDFEADLYSVAPARAELQGTPSYYKRQEVAATEVLMSGAVSPPNAGTQGSGAVELHGQGVSSIRRVREDDPFVPGPGPRVKDDDPVSPVEGGSGGGWRSWA